MENPEIDDIKAFLVETYENLNQIENDILDLEKNSSTLETLVRIYRNIHTIKGNSGFLPFPKLEAVAHAGENLLGDLRSGKLFINSDITNALLQTLDAIRQILARIEATGNESDDDYSSLIQTLASLHLSPVKTQFTNWSPPTTQPSENVHLVEKETSIRVDVGLLDMMMNLVGELVLARNQINEFTKNQENTAFTDTVGRLNLITNELHTGMMKTRLQTINTVWQKFPRVVRDIAKANGKQVEIFMSGAETELDRSIIEAIKDPLTHIIRNCIDHGIETPQLRTARNKPPQGHIDLRAYHEGGKVYIEISDDGNGITAEQLKQKAQELGLINANQAAVLSEREALNLIFLPGFSTAKQVSNLSGRGLGMNVVKNSIEKINGQVKVYSQPGQGTTFKIQIPLTLAIIPTLIVTSDFHRYAIPQNTIQELVRLEAEQAKKEIEILYDIPVFRLRGKILPLVYLNRELQISCTAEKEVIYIVVINAESYQFALIIDTPEDTQDIVVKPLGKQLKDISIFSGATILGDGKIALIIDVVGLANKAGLKQAVQEALSNTINTTVTEQQDKTETILLFCGVSGSRMGIELSLAFRLEEFSHSAITKVANQSVVQYRDTVLPLVNLQAIFGDKEKSSNDIIKVIVINSISGLTIGLVVKNILDIVEESLTVKGKPMRPGVLFNTVIQGEVTEILDIEKVISMANPYMLHVANNNS